MKHKPEKAPAQPKAPRLVMVAVGVKTCPTEPAQPQALIPTPKCPIIPVKCTIIPVTKRKDSAKPPLTKCLTSEVGTKAKKPKIDQDWVVLFGGRKGVSSDRSMGFHPASFMLGQRQWLGSGPSRSWQGVLN